MDYGVTVCLIHVSQRWHLGWAGSAGHPLPSEHGNHAEVQGGVCARIHLIPGVQAF